MTTNKIKIKPKFDFRYYGACILFLSIPIVCLPLLLFVYGEVGLIKFLIIISYLIGVYCILAFCVICPFYFLYSFYEFVIDDDKVSHINSFINYTQTDIKYADIKEVTLKRNFIQRWYDLGTISMTSNASIEEAGINFFNLKDPHKIHEIIQQKIAESKK